MKKKRSARRIERRRSTRADARLSMRVEAAPSEGERTQIVTETHNISANGVYCTSLHYLAPASKVALTIVLPRLPGMPGAKELIKCDGIVVRCEPPAKRGAKGFELACMFSGRAAANRGNGQRPAARARTAKRKVARAARGGTASRTVH